MNIIGRILVEFILYDKQYAHNKEETVAAESFKDVCALSIEVLIL